MPYNKTIVIDEIDGDSGSTVTVTPTNTLVVDRVDAVTGVAGFVASLGGTRVTPNGDVIVNSSATVQLGTGMSLTTVSGSITMTSAGQLVLDRGDQLTAHGVPKISEIVVNYGDFAAAATANSVDYTIESTYDWVVLDAFVRRVTAFTGGGATTVDLKADLSPLTGGTLIAAGQIDVFAGTPTLDGNAAADRGSFLSTFGVQTFAEQPTSGVRVTLTADVNLDQLTQGTCKIYVRHYTLPS